MQQHIHGRFDCRHNAAIRTIDPPTLPPDFPNSDFPLILRPMAQPVFGFVAFTSGSYEGAIIRDMRLANALHRRGYKVVIYWMMESNPELVDPSIPQSTLCSGLRYHFKRPFAFMDLLGRIFRIIPAGRRRRFVQARPGYVSRLMQNCCRSICDGDPALTRRLESLMIRDGVTHLLPTFAMICPFAQPIKEQRRHAFDYLVTFQGEEIFANFAAGIGRLDDFHRRLRETVAASGWPAIAVSRDYAQRLHEEMGIDLDRMTPIYPGIELPEEAPVDAAANFAMLKEIFPSLKPDVPIVTYLGRQDAEKGIDLLLYAVKILRSRGVKLQLLCVGGSSFGLKYADACKAIAEHLRLVVFWKRRVSNRVRGALYQQSRCIVYPSIHREPFGMVAAEAMSHGTPVVVPDHGGITEVVDINGQQGGLTFKAWDSSDLANQLERILTDQKLHAQLTANTRTLAELFSVDRLTDHVLHHMNITNGQLLASPATPSPNPDAMDTPPTHHHP
jgi:glycosyltransferase involved in cell wall biosynthesis